MNTTLLNFAKNDLPPQMRENQAELLPWHIQIHYDCYRREELFWEAQRSRACAYMANDDHRPLALDGVFLGGSPTVDVRDSVTGCVVERLTTRRQCVTNDEDQVLELRIWMATPSKLQLSRSSS